MAAGGAEVGGPGEGWAGKHGWAGRAGACRGGAGRAGVRWRPGVVPGRRDVAASRLYAGRCHIAPVRRAAGAGDTGGAGLPGTMGCQPPGCHSIGNAPMPHRGGSGHRSVTLRGGRRPGLAIGFQGRTAGGGGCLLLPGNARVRVDGAAGLPHRRGLWRPCPSCGRGQEVRPSSKLFAVHVTAVQECGRRCWRGTLDIDNAQRLTKDPHRK
jgi:hypothetical protein